VVHANARLTLHGRTELIARVQAGRPVAHVAAEMGISRATAYKWWKRWRHEGDAGLFDRSSRPHHSPNRTPRRTERRIEQLRRSKKLGPARIAGIVEMHPSTVHRVLVRQGLHRLRAFDRPTGRVIRRIHTTRPGELVHVDVKKLGRIPDGGGWWAHGRGNVARSRKTPTIGFDYIHTAIDAFSRVAYSEILDAENIETCVPFLARAHAWFSTLGITIERVLTDNGNGYRSFAWRDLCAELGVRHTRTRPYHPATNGKAERFNRTLNDEWARVRVYRRNHDRDRALDRWLHHYNHHRCHTALGGQPPMTRLNNVSGHNT
jgi:transposase InsO family protein